jgi:hypothetical protein
VTGFGKNGKIVTAYLFQQPRTLLNDFLASQPFALGAIFRPWFL